MELLPLFGVNCELVKDEFVRHLKCDCFVDKMRSSRQSLFMDALKLNLADSGEVLVTRRKMSPLKTVKEKHNDAIWMMTSTIRRCESVSCILLRNVK